jgi:glycerol-3-phosphate dehydrogenase (NAD(P)+)
MMAQRSPPTSHAGSIVVLGAGAWGTALAVQAARAGLAVSLWARDPARARAMAKARENARHLPGLRLSPAITVSADLGVLRGAIFALVAVPAQHMRAVLERLAADPPPLVVAAKGVEQGTLRLPLEIVEQVWPGLPAAILSGPNFAHEVANGLPAAAVVASRDAALRDRVGDLLGTPGFRLYGGDDPVGVQVGGAAKNVIAIAAGAVIGAGLGENARAALVTRGLAELARLTVALGGKPETAAGLSGLGDLLLTATGPGSRNTALGMELGRGHSLDQALAGKVSVAEGVATAPAIVARAAAAGVELPICAAVADLLAGDLTVADAMGRLLARPRRDE